MPGAKQYIPLTQELYAEGAASYAQKVTCVNLLAFQGYAGNVSLGSLPEVVVFEGGAQSNSYKSRFGASADFRVERAFDGQLSIDGDFPKLKTLAGSLGVYNTMDQYETWDVRMRSLFALEAVSSDFFLMSKGKASLSGPFKSYKGPCMCTTGLARLSNKGGHGDMAYRVSDLRACSLANQCSWEGGALFKSIPQCVPVFEDGDLPLEPELYSKGPMVYQQATCVPDDAFNLNPSVIELSSMPKLKTIGKFSFATRSAKGYGLVRMIMSALGVDSERRLRIENGSFPLLEQIGAMAFYGNGLKNPFELVQKYGGITSSDSLVQIGSLPSLKVIGFGAFGWLGNHLDFQGEYPALEVIGSYAFMPGGMGYWNGADRDLNMMGTYSKISMESLGRLKYILRWSFKTYRGRFVFSGVMNDLELIASEAFSRISEAANVAFFSKDCSSINMPAGTSLLCSQALSIVRLDKRTNEDEKYTNPTGTPAPTYIAGETYRIAPFKLDVDESIFTLGDVSDVTYTLSGQKETIDNWFISASTGIIIGNFDAPGNYTFNVDIVDGGGQQGVLETHDFEVIPPPTFTVQKYEHFVPSDLEAGAYAFLESSNDTMSNDPDRQPGDHVQRPYFGVRSVTTGTAGLSYQTVYAGVSVRLPPIDLVEYESGGVRYTQETPRTEAITFTIEDQPRGFFIDPATSEILGSPSLSTDEDGSESNVRTATIYAVNAAQEKAFVEQIRFTVVEQDVSVDTNGPRNRTCANGGVKVDGTNFDGKFTCDCSSTPYVDENCETAIACNRSQTLDVQTCIDFKLDYDTSVRATASDDYTEPSNMVGTYYAVGQTYLISPFKLRKNSTTPSVGTFDELQYALDGSLPNGMFLKPKSGEIQVSFSEKDANTIYNVDVDVVDKGGARITIDVLDFPVRYRDVEDPFNKDAFGPNNTACKNGGVPIDNGNEFDNKYECDCSSTGYQGGNCEIAIPRVTSCPKNATLVDGVCKYFELDIDRLSRKEKSGTTYTDPVDIAMQNSFYAVNQSYRVASFEILNTTRPSDGNVSIITYTLAAGAPDNFFLSTATGEIFWQFEEKDAEKSFAVTLNAVDRAGAVQEVETMVMRVKYNDVDVPQYGPNRMACNKTNTREVVDTTPFDTIFECDCALGFGGDNCDLPRDGTVPAFGPHSQACSNNSNIIDDIPFNQEFECACHSGYGGDNCEYPLDSSIPAYGPANRTCSINGDIVDMVPFDQEFECKCHSGYGGDNCERNLDAEASAQAKETMILGVAVGASVVVLILVFAIVKYYRSHTAKKDARAALDNARRAYGLPSVKKDKSPKEAGAHHRDHVTNPTFIGITLDDGLGNSDENQNTPPHSDELDYSTIPSVPESSSQGGTSSKFVAPMITLGENTLAAKGLNLLLGVDPKTYMHVRNKIAVMLKEFAKNGTPEDNENIKRLIDGSYKNPDAADDAPRERSLAEVMRSPEVATAGLGLHHVLALRVYTSSSYRSINNPMRQSPPVLPHPFAATLYYISDALSKLREVQGRDPAVRVETMVFWRGMKNLDITDEFVRTGGTEMACMSTTSSQAVAEEFAESESPLLFKFVSRSFMSHGADISFLSVYPGEKEVLYPPLTYLRPIGLSQQTINGKVYKVAEVEPIFPAK